MQFSRLRITGFKSFVDPTELYIEKGLTGIVGPNGCGKSNLVEALRWVMGETSAKQMRGGEMDDVIFAGTSERPARNISEVILTLDNAERNAPAHFNDTEEIDVARRIERGSGSAYRVNGREVRARDVQTLFADAASGARSNALVSQGRIGAIINAKPADRRMLLEEAAGIRGLHARRHEAELRLKGAETNLERLDDVLSTLEEQFRALKRQARQATRYRNLSDHIRRAESIVLHHRWSEATRACEAAKAGLSQAAQAVEVVTREVSAASTLQAQVASEVPALRQNEAEAAAVLQRLRVAQDALEQEEQRLADLRRDLEARLNQIDSDTEREKGLRNDASTAIAALEREATEIRAAQTNEQQDLADAEQRQSQSEAEVAALEQALTKATQDAAADEARQATLSRQITDQEARKQRLTERRSEIADQRREAEEEVANASALTGASEAARQAREALEAARSALESAEGERTAAQQAETDAREALQQCETATGKLKAEESALSELLQLGDPELWPPMIDAVEVEPGYEIALGAALGDDLVAPSDESAPVHWRALAPYASTVALPGGIVPLSNFVKAPPALARRISQIGVVTDDAEGERLRDQLMQGQRLVSTSGSLWRWDGFTATEGAPTAATRRLEQRNRLVDLATERAAAERDEASARARFEDAHRKAQTASEAERAARETAWSSDRAFQEARDAETAAAQDVANAKSRLESLTETGERLQADIAEVDSLLQSLRTESGTFGDLPARREAIDRQRGELVERRRVLTEHQSARDRLARDADARRERLGTIAADIESWRTRANNAEEQMAQLGRRREDVAAEAAKLDARPAEIAEQRTALLAQIDDAEGKRNTAADTLARAETRLNEAGRDLKAKETRLAETREERIRREAAVEQADQALTTVSDRVRERLKCRPDAILESAGISPDETLPELEASETKLERLLRERDNMGPVNLRAEMEASELNERITTTQGEREDLVAAISKLRQGIAGLNREGRERLLTAFEEVDGHFRALFARLFGGGRAHLSLTEAEDPLDAGLEIMASPPGKRLQNMSLLSGGEQALTALALLFAVFMTNPAPVCVLDEVDAPLDDNNVDRFCTMLEEISEQAETRFVLITHHRLTMARMDRLYGVTMAERGVSQLVSVDLQAAEGLRERVTEELRETA